MKSDGLTGSSSTQGCYPASSVLHKLKMAKCFSGLHSIDLRRSLGLVVGREGPSHGVPSRLIIVSC